MAAPSKRINYVVDLRAYATKKEGRYKANIGKNWVVELGLIPCNMIYLLNARKQS